MHYTAASSLATIRSSLHAVCFTRPNVPRTACGHIPGIAPAKCVFHFKCFIWMYHVDRSGPLPPPPVVLLWPAPCGFPACRALYVGLGAPVTCLWSYRLLGDCPCNPQVAGSLRGQFCCFDRSNRHNILRSSRNKRKMDGLHSISMDPW